MEHKKKRISGEHWISTKGLFLNKNDILLLEIHLKLVLKLTRIDELQVQLLLEFRDVMNLA